jgi:hypothetical protein
VSESHGQIPSFGNKWRGRQDAGFNGIVYNLFNIIKQDTNRRRAVGSRHLVKKHLHYNLI